MSSLLSVLATFILTLTSITQAQTYGLPVAPAGNTTSIPIRILTHNIRYNTTSLFTGETPWPGSRGPRLINQDIYNTRFIPEAFICHQEALNNQVIDILTGLNAGNTTNEWAYIGVGRNDGATQGEYSPIFYRPSIWHLDDFRTVWLSPTPDVPSGPAWDAGSIRILTIGVFTHVASGREVVGMCTHLDNAGTISRYNSALIIADRIGNYTGTSPNSTYTGPIRPVWLGGDFNSEPSQEAYGVLNGTASPVYDLESRVPEAQRYGDVGTTFTGFTEDTSDDSLIDFIFLGPKNKTFWDVEGYAVLPNKFDDGVYDSDHRAVVGDVILI